MEQRCESDLELVRMRTVRRSITAKPDSLPKRRNTFHHASPYSALPNASPDSWAPGGFQSASRKATDILRQQTAGGSRLQGNGSLAIP